MTRDFHSDLLGDLFIYNIDIDFIKKTSTLIFGLHPEKNVKKTYQLTFSSVFWQEFNQFQDFNILFDVEESDDIEEFKSKEAEYLKKMKNYMPRDFFSSLEKEREYKIYFLRATTGVGGFVICKEASVISIGQ